MKTFALIFLLLLSIGAACGEAPEVEQKHDVPAGTLTAIEYDSKAVGAKRKVQVYTPPGYSRDGAEKYPLLILLHGAGGDERDWQKLGSAAVIFDNLLHEKKMVPMVVAMPFGYGMPPGKRVDKNSPPEDRTNNRTRFYADTLDELFPYLLSHYNLYADREHTAVAGLSMGGNQALTLGFGHMDRFAWIGCFSAAMNGPAATDAIEKLGKDAAGTNAKLKLLWISSGNKDPNFAKIKKFGEDLQAGGVHVRWSEGPGAHEWPVWRRNLAEFAPLLFK